MNGYQRQTISPPQPQPKRRKLYVLCALLTLSLIVGAVWMLFFHTTGADFESVGLFVGSERTIATITVNGNLGLIDVLTGEEILPPLYDMIWSIHNDIAHVRRSVDRLEGLVKISTGEEIIPFEKYDMISPRLSDGLAVVWLDEKFSVIDIQTGAEIIPFGQFDRISGRGSFYDGMAVIEQDGQEGVIELKSGKEVIPFGRFDQIHSLRNGMAIVELDGQEGVIALPSGEEVIPLGTFAWVTFINPNGTIGVCNDVSRNTRIQSRRGNDMVGLVDSASGEILVPLTYTFVSGQDRYGIVIVERGGNIRHQGYVGAVELATGEEIIPVGLFDFVQILTVNLAGVRQGDTWGILDFRTGEEIIPLGQYVLNFCIFNGMAVVRDMRGNLGVIDIETGEEIISFGRFEGIRLFAEGVVAVQNRNQLWRFAQIEDLV